jgi:tetratricopeptide (TPR) repeat protein
LEPMQPFKAHVHNGRLMLDVPTELPEGEVVELVPFNEVLARRAAPAMPFGVLGHPGDDDDALASVLRLARSHVEAGRYGDAIVPLTQATHLAPNNAGVLHQLGSACLLERRIPEAILWLRRSIAVRPTVARVHLELGMALAQTGDDKRAIAALSQAITLDPNLTDAHGQLGDVLRRHHRVEEAVSAYEQAFRAAPTSSYGLLCKAKALVAEGRTDEGEERMKQVIARSASGRADAVYRAEAHTALGHLLLETGRLDEGRATLERAIELAPRQADAYHALVTSKKITEDDRAIVDRILARLEAREPMSVYQRMALHFAAGKALDDLRDYGAAIKQFDAANEIRGKIAPFNGDDLRRLVDSLIARFTHDFFTGNGALGGQDETPVLVLGMPRSGTTLIERIISSHPNVGGGGELPFWNRNGPAWIEAPTERLAAAVDRIRPDYLQVLRRIGPNALRVTDKMPFNFMWVGLVHTLLPNARVVHCRRNPVDTCLSIYSTHFRGGFASSRGDLVAYYRQYRRLMDHWRAVLPADRLLDVDYEEATAAPEETARRLIAFCGLTWDPACVRPDRNANVVRTANVWGARQPIYGGSVERWRNYEPWIGELRDLLSDDGGTARGA